MWIRVRQQHTAAPTSSSPHLAIRGYTGSTQLEEKLVTFSCKGKPLLLDWYQLNRYLRLPLYLERHFEATHRMIRWLQPRGGSFCLFFSGYGVLIKRVIVAPQKVLRQDKHEKEMQASKQASDTETNTRVKLPNSLSLLLTNQRKLPLLLCLNVKTPLNSNFFLRSVT